VGAGDGYARRVSRASNLWTIVGVIVAVVIAWFVVDFALHLAYLLWKLALVAIVAVIVFFVLRVLFRSGRKS
jgi:di/tricarboxylate transporter